MAAQLKVLSCALYCTGMHLHFLQSEAYSFHFVCVKVFTFAKKQNKTKKAILDQVRKSNTKVLKCINFHK